MRTLLNILPLLLLVLAFSPSDGAAQRSFGFRGGMTIAEITNPDILYVDDFRPKKDYTMGYFIEFEIKQPAQRTTNLVFQTGMTYERRGQRSSGLDEAIGAQAQLESTLKYFTFPIILKKGLMGSDVVNLMVGPEFSLLYLATEELDYVVTDPETGVTIDRAEIRATTPAYKSVDVSITAGVAIDIPITKNLRIPLDARVGKSLMDVRSTPSRFDESASHFLFKFNTGVVMYY